MIGRTPESDEPSGDRIPGSPPFSFLSGWNPPDGSERDALPDECVIGTSESSLAAGRRPLSDSENLFTFYDLDCKERTFDSSSLLFDTNVWYAAEKSSRDDELLAKLDGDRWVLLFNLSGDTKTDPPGDTKTDPLLYT
jgi:hypothetical protein